MLDGLPSAFTGGFPARAVLAASELIDACRVTHTRPPFGIESVTCGGRKVQVAEVIARRTPFATLVHFAKDVTVEQPRVLLVAPLSGHFSTLVRDTVRTMLPDHDVYLTDWHNARDVPLRYGRFGLDEYIDHVIEFLEAVGPGAHAVAVCQPCVQVLAATAVMAATGHPAAPCSATLIAGPIDARVNPGAVNLLATKWPLSWFERNMIAAVPFPQAGMMRRVYPGRVQLAAFLNMNLDRHAASLRRLYLEELAGGGESAERIKDFYREYFAVLDLPAEFYLETVDQVFQRFLLPRGLMRWRGQPVDPGAISATALMTIEGERDDISPVGQTVAAHGLCSGLSPRRKRQYLQTGVGHYGVFSGKRWQRNVYPALMQFIRTSERGTRTRERIPARAAARRLRAV